MRSTRESRVRSHIWCTCPIKRRKLSLAHQQVAISCGVLGRGASSGSSEYGELTPLRSKCVRFDGQGAEI